ncbi:MAG: hypothetical protein AAFZ15_00525 [Bacteroidota bacterium]
MNKNQTYRPVAACFLAALVIQVFVLKGLHHCMGQCTGQDGGIKTCSVEGPLLQVEKKGNLLCSICLFHFTPTDFHLEGWTIQLSDLVPDGSQFSYRQYRLVQEFRQACLRGPPAAKA